MRCVSGCRARRRRPIPVSATSACGPTFGGEPRLLVEVHLLDTAIDLYGLALRVDLIARLRDEQRFNGIEELKAQIARDAEAARRLLARPPVRTRRLTSA